MEWAKERSCVEHGLESTKAKEAGHGEGGLKLPNRARAIDPPVYSKEIRVGSECRGWLVARHLESSR